MTKETANHLKLGIFVATGTVILILALYFIGAKRNVFSSTFPVRAVFHNVSGLMPGNNVRLSGIDVGTVKSIVIENDSTVIVNMNVQKKVRPFIKKNATATLGTDGLVGSKLVNIIPDDDPNSPLVDDDDILTSIKTVETEEMLRTLNTTNANLADITGDLRNITSRLRSGNGIMRIFEDTATVENLERTFDAFRDVAENSKRITDNLNKIVLELRNTSTLAGTLLYDTATASRFKSVVRNLDHLTDSLAMVSDQLNVFSQSLNNPDGVMHALTKDPALKSDIKGTVSNLKQSTELLNENLKAMRQNFLFRRYFKKQKGN